MPIDECEKFLGVKLCFGEVRTENIPQCTHFFTGKLGEKLGEACLRS